jgi:hypothetical protein
MEPKPEEYYLLMDGDTAGPYTLADLHAMWMEDKITLDTLFVRPGMHKCQPVNLILGLVISYNPAQPVLTPPVEDEGEHPLAPFRPLLRWGLVGLILGLTLWAILSSREQSGPDVLIMRAVVQVKQADLNIFNESDFEWQDMFVHLNGQPPEGYRRKLTTLRPGQSIDLTLLEFTDPAGDAFQPWSMSVTDVWIGNEKRGYRPFRVRPMKP